MHVKQHITDLAAICLKKGIRKVVISPGSRSAPIIQAFLKCYPGNCHSIVDERSAGYFALGLALAYQQPVALICTSGTAALNYAPALAEAYYQKIPLLAITADRAYEWIDQQDNQTLHQRDIYKNFIKSGFELPQNITHENELWFAHRLINEAVNLLFTEPAGPVHLNIPLPEPLYDALPEVWMPLPVIPFEKPDYNPVIPERLIDLWNHAKSILIVHGQHKPDADLTDSIIHLSHDPRIAVIAENVSNIPADSCISNSHLVLSINRKNLPAQPDLVLHSGGQVVSKSLTAYLRNAKHTKLWRIGNDHRLTDTYKIMSEHIALPASAVYKALASKIHEDDEQPGYRFQWKQLAESSIKKAVERISQLPYSDIHVFFHVLRNMPEDINVFLGNSSIIRYAQLFNAPERVCYYSNRGTSGIDGCLSTASGIASASGKPTIAILGDLGFLYDSNALWNRELSANLKILVINNHGGGIFHIIKGPSESAGFKEFIEAHHPVNIAKLAEAYNLAYLTAENEADLKARWPEFIARSNKPMIFEVTTDAELSASTFRALMAGN